MKSRKIIPTECSLGQLRRVINCITVAGEDDKYVYCGTSTGDILQVSTTLSAVYKLSISEISCLIVSVQISQSCPQCARSKLVNKDIIASTIFTIDTPSGKYA